MTKVQIKFDNSAFKGIPLHEIGPSFNFIVNDKEYQTSKIVAQILCPKIKEQYSDNCDINEFRIDTEDTVGDFQKFIDLIQVGHIEIQENEVPFASFILTALENNLIKIELPEVQVNDENIFDLIKQHDKYQIIYSKQLQDDIDFIAVHFALAKDKTPELLSLSFDTLTKIISHQNLMLESEDQLLALINQLYKTKKEYSALYQYVNFIKISTEKMIEFTENFNCEHMKQPIWHSISYRLQQP